MTRLGPFALVLVVLLHGGDARPQEEAVDTDGGVAPAVVLDGPREGASTEERERWLAERVSALIAARPALGQARVGVAVIDIARGRTLVSRSADEVMNVASNVKLVTTAAALSTLGPTYRFHTSFLVGKTTKINAGTVEGDLILRGGGDPTLDPQGVYELVRLLELAGVRRVTGSLIIDDGFFDGAVLPPAFEQKREDAAFRAPVSGASLNYNAVGVYVQPASAGEAARIAISPPSSYIDVRSTVMTVGEGRTSLRIATKATKDRTEITLSGQIRAGEDPRRFLKRVEHPTLHTGEAVRALLVAQGIRVGKLKLGTTPVDARLLALHESEPLAVIARDINKHSNNFMAETVLKTLGAEAGGLPGTWDKGLTVVRGWLDAQGIKGYRYDNGSGLYDSNRFSASHLAEILRAMYLDFRVGPDYVASLAIAGRDGTLVRRMKGGRAEGRVRAKTGTLNQTSCLAGYAGTTGAPVVFVVLVDAIPLTGNAFAQARSLQDELAEALVLYLGS
jgi:serine-type D-Ala-D-Ala carboxypeptidase/endopeptidase (penicillin-binding protein 4)